MLSRRHFLRLLGSAAVLAAGRVRAQDWEVESPIVTRMREHLQWVIGGMGMAPAISASDTFVMAQASHGSAPRTCRKKCCQVQGTAELALRE